MKGLSTRRYSGEIVGVKASRYSRRRLPPWTQTPLRVRSLSQHSVLEYTTFKFIGELPERTPDGKVNYTISCLNNNDGRCRELCFDREDKNPGVHQYRRKDHESRNEDLVRRTGP